MWIERTLASRAVELAAQFPAVLVTGTRQTGKTSLLRHTFPKAAFVSLDLPSAAHQAEENPQEFLRSRSEPVIIDEVQYAPGLFRHLKLRIDEQRHSMGRFLMTGSQKFSLMQSLSESLAGRCAVLELDTLSSQETRAALGGKSPTAAEFIWRGGFPELWRNPALNARDFFASYVATYLERDVRLALRVGSLRDFERFVRSCALRSGQLLNMADLARDVGVAGSTARDWISVLEASNQVLLLEPYFNNRGKRMIKTPKLYFRDTGLLSFLLGLDSPEAAARSPFVGALWETFVLNQLLRAKAATGSAATVFFWRDAHGTEVDFVLEHQGRLRLIEAKWVEQVADARALQPMQKVLPLLGKRAAKEHWLVCRTAHSHSLPNQPGIRLINGYTFTDWLID
jgi:predicted AAA+ superfamily ATPase